MKEHAREGCRVSEEDVQALVSVLFAEDDGASHWVRVARLFLEGVMLASRELDEPWALKIEEGSDDREDGQRNWTN